MAVNIGAIVDAHHHVWSPHEPSIGYGWLRDVGAPKPFGDPTPIQRDYLWPEFLAEGGAPPAASVHVQADNAADGLAEVAWVVLSARAVGVRGGGDRDGGHRVGVVGYVDLSAPDAPSRIAALSAWPEVRGVRQIVARDAERPGLSFTQRDLLAEATWRYGLAALAPAGLSFDLQLYAHQIDAALEALAETPDLRVIVDHAASPVDGPTPAWRRAVAALATRPDTFIKLSGWGMYDANWSADSIAPMVDHVLTHFGEDRTMFGSNYPVEKLVQPYQDVVSATFLAITTARASPNIIFNKSASNAYKLA